MREEQRKAFEQTMQNARMLDHAGLAYDTWAPVDLKTRKGSDRENWLKRFDALPIPADYHRFFSRWRASFDGKSGCVVEIEMQSRLLIGHGNSSATDVGISLHQTWGVPVIPGSALKGLLSQYLDVVYGPEGDGLDPSRELDDAIFNERLRYQRAVRKGRSIVYGPGDVQRILFGAPEAVGDGSSGATRASRGEVEFHDALLVATDKSTVAPFATDVLTVHQKAYYDGAGKADASDYDDPNPVSFLSVRPGPDSRFLLAVTGPIGKAEFTVNLLLHALKDWGVGGKTSLGYGRAVAVGKLHCNDAVPAPSELLQDFLEFLDSLSQRTSGNAISDQALLRQVEVIWLEKLRHLSDQEKDRARRKLKGSIKRSSRRKAVDGMF